VKVEDILVTRVAKVVSMMWLTAVTERSRSQRRRRQLIIY